MSGGPLIAGVSLLYLGLLFAIAHWADRRAARGRSVIAHPAIYALSLAVYCTAWTFYGSVGRAAETGLGFLPIYLGPTLAAALWGVLLLKMVRVSKSQRITSIADFIASRYGKSHVLGGLVTVIAVVGVVPYIALQLKAVSSSFSILLQYPEIRMPRHADTLPVWQDTALYVALVLAAFTVLFGARHLDASERHEGMVAAIAFESIVKLAAFIAVGLFVTFGLYGGFGEVFRMAREAGYLKPLLGPALDGYRAWFSLSFLSALAVLLLPRQFQMGVVENSSEHQLRRAVWMFPLYLLLINIFVLPIALAGQLELGAGVDADTFVLTLPMAHRQESLALFAYIGGLSAATGMVIVETVALSTMVCNDLVMPGLLRRWQRVAPPVDLSVLLLRIRRGAIFGILLLGYLYFRLAGEAYALVSIGLISFAAVAQFAPAMIGGLYWRGGTREGALAGLSAGFLMWAYTLLLPSFAKSGWLPAAFVDLGPFGLSWLKPQALFGLEGWDQISHCLFWSLAANTGAFVLVSLLRVPNAAEAAQAGVFVDALKNRRSASARFWRGGAEVSELMDLAGRFLGAERARQAFYGYAGERGLAEVSDLPADAQTVHFVETLLAGAIGSASARVMVASVAQEEPLGLEEVLDILDEASQIRAYSRELEQKSRELEAASAELRAANVRLQELDRLKDDFMSSVTHELRTPLTSIRAFSEILHEDPEADLEDRKRFLGIIVSETERLSRLVNQVLDLAKIESTHAEWRLGEVDLAGVIRESVQTTEQLFRDKGAVVQLDLMEGTAVSWADRDRLMQVMLNLLSNAAKFVPADTGSVEVRLKETSAGFQVDVMDNGQGIQPDVLPAIFEKFRQGGDDYAKPVGTGLGLPICRQIIEHLGGRIWVQSTFGKGATFSFTLPPENRDARAGKSRQVHDEEDPHRRR
ncbi:MAG: sensor histidine kinase [Pseudomonadota bacterium]|nr:sensor histidine kinase [Pseudomonadota bacterium]